MSDRPGDTRREPAPVEAIVAGMVAALQLYLREAGLERIVGESGRLEVALELVLEKGVVRWTDGSVNFQRRVRLS